MIARQISRSPQSLFCPPSRLLTINNALRSKKTESGRGGNGNLTVSNGLRDKGSDGPKMPIDGVSTMAYLQATLKHSSLYSDWRRGHWSLSIKCIRKRSCSAAVLSRSGARLTWNYPRTDGICSLRLLAQSVSGTEEPSVQPGIVLLVPCITHWRPEVLRVINIKHFIDLARQRENQKSEVYSEKKRNKSLYIASQKD